MKENLSKQIASSVFVKEENQLNWKNVLKELRITFGDDVYESWIKNIDLKKEFNHYVVLSAPTRFVRDWIVSRYADKVLDIIKNFKPSIQRIEFLIDEQDVQYNNQEQKKEALDYFFNPTDFRNELEIIDFKDFTSIEKLSNRILEIDSDKDLYEHMVLAPPLKMDKIMKDFKPSTVLNKILTALDL